MASRSLGAVRDRLGCLLAGQRCAIVQSSVLGWRRGGNRGADPVRVTGGPLAVRAQLREHRVHEADELRVLLGDRQAVGLVGEPRARPAWSTGPARPARPGSSRRWRSRPRRPAAAAPGSRSSTGRRPGSPRPAAIDAERVGPGGRAHLLAPEVGQARRRRVLQHQDPLARVEVDAGEVDLLQPGAGDRHRVRHDVHGAGEDVGYPLSIGDGLELDLVRVAEDRLGHRADHVDVEALDLPVERVEEAEVVGALVHSGDEVTAGADLGHERARRHLRRPGRAQAAGMRVTGRGAGHAGRAGRVGRGRPGLAPRRRPRYPEPARTSPAPARARAASALARAFTGTPRGGG